MSYLVSLGLTPYEIAERIGDTVTVVLETYAHFFNNSQMKVKEAIDRDESFQFDID